MNIDLTNIGNGHELNAYEMMHLKGSYLYRSLLKANNDTNSNFNYLIISMSVFNAIDSHPMFVPWSDAKYIDGSYYVGRLGAFECYVDLYLPPNDILMKYNKSVARDNVLDIILSDSKIINEAHITVDGL